MDWQAEPLSLLNKGFVFLLSSRFTLPKISKKKPSLQPGRLLFQANIRRITTKGSRCGKTLFLGELTDTFRFQEDLPNGPHEPLPMWSPQENDPPPLPDCPSASLLLGKTNDAPAIPSLAARQIATPTPPLPLSFRGSPPMLWLSLRP